MKFIDKETYEDKHGIYAVMCLDDGCIYIGKTEQTFIRRFYEHSERLQRNVHDNKYLQNVFNKYGTDSFIFFCVQAIETEDINETEKHIIQIAREHFATCSNMLDGGEVDYKSLGKLNAERLRGSKLSEETKLKMSETKKGKPHDTSKMKAALREIYLEKKYGCNTALRPIEVIAVKKLLAAGLKQKVISNLLQISIYNIAAIATERAWDFIKVNEFNDWRLTKQRKNPRQHRAES